MVPDTFCGREGELKQIIHEIKHNSKSVAIIGPPGAGKTALATKVIWDEGLAGGMDRFFIRCDGVFGLRDLLNLIAIRLHLHGADLEEQIINFFETHCSILVLDNTETPREQAVSRAAIDQFLARLDSSPNLTLVITMRTDKAPMGIPWHVLELQGLHPEAAREVFLRNCTSPKHMNDTDLDELLQEMGYLPLAIILVAAVAHTAPDIRWVLDRWMEEHTALLHLGDDRSSSFEVSLECSVRSSRIVSYPDAWRLLTLLAALPTGITHPDLRSIFPVGVGRAHEILLQATLAYHDGPRVRVLPPIRAFVIRKVEDIQVLTPALTHFFGLAAQFCDIGKDDGKLLQRISPEVGNIQFLIRLCFNRCFMVQRAIQAAMALMSLMAYTEFGESSFLDLVLDQARSFGNIPLLAECSVRVGDVRRHRVECDADYRAVEVLYANALAIFQQCDNTAEYARCLLKMGELGILQNHVDQAELQITEALSIFTQLNNLHGRADAQRCLGDIALDKGENFLADQYYKAALPFHEDIGGNLILICPQIYKIYFDFMCFLDLLGKAFTLAAHGEVSLRFARLGQGRQHVQQALLIFKNQGNRWGQAYCNRVLGMLAFARGDVSAAAIHYRHALQHCTPQDVEYAHCLRELGCLGLRQGNKTDAKIYLTQALDIYVTHNYPSGKDDIEKLLLATVESSVSVHILHIL